MMETNNTVSVGITSVIGWLTALLGLLPTIIKAVEEGQVDFNGPQKYLAILGIASGLITQIGRYLQAHQLIKSSTGVVATSALLNAGGFGVGEEPHSRVDDLPIAPPSAAGEVPKDNSVLSPPVSAE